jgi:hypothetical protein
VGRSLRAVTSEHSSSSHVVRELALRATSHAIAAVPTSDELTGSLRTMRPVAQGRLVGEAFSAMALKGLAGRPASVVGAQQRLRGSTVRHVEFPRPAKLEAQRVADERQRQRAEARSAAAKGKRQAKQQAKRAVLSSSSAAGGAAALGTDLDFSGGGAGGADLSAFRLQ